MMKDFHDWCHYLNIDDFRFSDAFPITSIPALRATIVNTDDKLRAAICKSLQTFLSQVLSSIMSLLKLSGKPE